MESRSYNFSTSKKRSTLLVSKGIEFPKEDPSAPRMLIVKKECPAEFESYNNCLAKGLGDVCLKLRDDMFECGRPGFKKANTDPNYVY